MKLFEAKHKANREWCFIVSDTWFNARALACSALASPAEDIVVAPLDWKSVTAPVAAFEAFERPDKKSHDFHMAWFKIGAHGVCEKTKDISGGGATTPSQAFASFAKPPASGSKQKKKASRSSEKGTK